MAWIVGGIDRRRHVAPRRQFSDAGDGMAVGDAGKHAPRISQMSGATRHPFGGVLYSVGRPTKRETRVQRASRVAAGSQANGNSEP